MNPDVNLWEVARTLSFLGFCFGVGLYVAFTLCMAVSEMCESVWRFLVGGKRKDGGAE